MPNSTFHLTTNHGLMFEGREDGSILINGFLVTGLRKDIDCDGDQKLDTELRIHWSRNNEEPKGWIWNLDTNTNDADFAVLSAGHAGALSVATREVNTQLARVRRMFTAETLGGGPFSDSELRGRGY